MGAGMSEVEEIEATHFAVALLLPEALVRQKVRERGGVDVTDDADMARLAKEFGVNTSLMAFRIGQLKGTRA